MDVFHAVDAHAWCAMCVYVFVVVVLASQSVGLNELLDETHRIGSRPGGSRRGRRPFAAVQSGAVHTADGRQRGRRRGSAEAARAAVRRRRKVVVVLAGTANAAARLERLIEIFVKRRLGGVAAVIVRIAVEIVFVIGCCEEGAMR